MIPVNEPLLSGHELEYVTECIRSGWISSAGHYITEFESKWAQYCGRKYGVAVCNGTAALQASVAALKIAPGDEVIMPSFTMISCALAVLYSAGMPVLVDSNQNTWTMDINRVADKITSRTRAIMAIHIYGHPVDMDPLVELAERHNLVLIEDAAEGHGAEYLSGRTTVNPSWRRCGSFGALSCFSFYANKLITTGEGGMVLTDDLALAERVRSLRNLYFQEDRRFYHEELGFNFRMTNVQAALGLAQMERIEELIAKKRWIGQEYTKRLQGISGLQLPVVEPWARNIYWMYGVVVAEETGIDARALAQKLTERGVETRPFFWGMHEQPVFRNRGWFRNESYPVTERLSRRGLYLPSGMALSEEQLAHVATAVREIVAQ